MDIENKENVALHSHFSFQILFSERHQRSAKSYWNSWEWAESNTCVIQLLCYRQVKLSVPFNIIVMVYESSLKSNVITSDSVDVLRQYLLLFFLFTVMVKLTLNLSKFLLILVTIKLRSILEHTIV